MRSRSRAWLFATTLLSASAYCGIASAQERDPARAEALFQEGKTALDKGDLATACAKLQESQKADPAPGTLYYWADCEERRGRLATAWGLFVEIRSKLPDGDPQKPTVIARAEGLEPRVPRVTFVLASGVDPSATVRRDNTEFGAASLGVPVPIDPGKHLFVVTAPGHLPRETSLDIAEAMRDKTFTLDQGPIAPLDKPISGPDDIGSASGGAQVPVGITIGVIGVVAMGVGVGVGVAAKLKYDGAKDMCPSNVCGTKGFDTRNDARTLGDIGTVTFFIGLAGTVTGAVVWMTAPSEEGGLASREPPIRVGVGPGTITVGGTW